MNEPNVDWSESDIIFETHVPALPKRSGKVRDVYDCGRHLALVATDRISAFDWILPTGIANKGQMLTGLSLFWFHRLNQPNHLLTDRLDEIGPAFAAAPAQFAGRTLGVHRLTMVPVECVVRGYLLGTAWLDYQQTGMVCGLPLPPGLRLADRLPEPIFTPATKSSQGHDQNITIPQMIAQLGETTTQTLMERSLAIYQQAVAYCETKNLILADTKIEFGWTETGNLLLADEVLTMDSSRYWAAENYRPGISPPSYDKQFVRDWLESIHFDKVSPPPPLPREIQQQTRLRYLQAFELITGESFANYLHRLQS